MEKRYREFTANRVRVQGPDPLGLNGSGLPGGSGVPTRMRRPAVRDPGTRLSLVNLRPHSGRPHYPPEVGFNNLFGCHPLCPAPSIGATDGQSARTV